MPQTTVPLPYGLRDVRVTPMVPGGEALGTGVDLPNARTFSFSEAEDFAELRGDDGLVALHGQGPAVDWSLEGGGCSFEAVRALFGGTIVETGTTPNQIKTFTKLGTDIRPYIQVEGQSISDSGGDFHCVLFKARCTGELSGEMSDGNFWLTGASGKALPKTTATGAAIQSLYKFVQNETATAIP